VRAALLRQWDLIAAHVPTLDLERPSRVAGWRNRDVLAHLTSQPHLLVRFLATASSEPPAMTLVDNLSGTARFASMIDESVRRSESIDFAAAVEAARASLAAADLSQSITTLQGSIRVDDYLRTRCVEAVVHGRDFVPPAPCDSDALAVAAAALLDVLRARRPDLVAAARALPDDVWVDAATGRVTPPDGLAGVLPLLR